MLSIVTVAVVLLLPAVAVIILSALNRWRFARAKDSFPCKARALDEPSGLWPRLGRDWPRRRVWARWVADVLVVRQGLLGSRSVTLRVDPAEGGIRHVPAAEVRRCGRYPLAMCLRLPDGSRVELAAPGSARIAMVGPFLAAAVHALPQAPSGRRRSPRQNG
ncbi:hypothetical protein ACQP2Y_12920 [Actinoplanes sp. CA-051413]|uniref:hypothetical protein n=1 Tax=Actinoplanes sp. CA-051413 TaxID=3239899 RepID=UPI003D96BED5